MSLVAPSPSPLPSQHTMSSSSNSIMSESDLNRSQADGAPRSNASAKRKADDASGAPAEQQPDAEPTQLQVKRKKTEAAAAAATPVKSAAAPAPPPKDPIVTFKGNKLTLNQKNLRPTIRKQLPTNAGIVAINTYLEECTEPLNSIPDEHLAIVATLAQESDKGIVELAKEIKEELAPSMGESQEEEGPSASQLLTLAAVQSAINAVATRENYGIIGTATLREDAIPTSLQLWRWEARDSAHLSPKLRDTLLKRRQERVEARAESLRLIAALPQEERLALFTLRKRGRSSDNDAVEVAARASSDTVLAMAAAEGVVTQTASSSTPSSSKAAAAAPATRMEPIIILDGGDDDEEITASGSSKPSTSTPAKASSSSSTPAKSGSSATKKSKVKPPPTAEQLQKKQAQEERKREAERKKSEKAAKEAEKTAKLEKKKAVEAKQRDMMFSFAKRERSTSPSKAEIARKSDFDQVFVPIQYKDAAPINRFAKPASSELLSSIGVNAAPASALLLDFKTNAPQRRRKRGGKTSRKGIHPSVSVREAMRLISEAGVMGGSAEEDARRSIRDLADRRRVPVKLLQFDGDRRPAWFGTWTRSSNLVGPRKPLGQDPVALDYNYDSDFEWEEEGAVEGEEIADDDARDDDAATDDDGGSEMDDWLEDDLVEDVEEGDASVQPMDIDPDIVPCDAKGNPLPAAPSLPASAFARPSALTAPASLLAPNLLVAKKKTKAPNKRKFNKLVPFSTGPHWETTLGTPAYDNFAPYQIEFINSARPGLNPFTWVEPDLPALVPDTTESAASSRPAKQAVLALDANGSASILPPAGTRSGSGATDGPAVPVAPKKLFPADKVPALLRLIHGSTRNKALLVETAKETFAGVSKVAIEYALYQYFEPRPRKSKDAWSAKREFRAQAGL